MNANSVYHLVTGAKLIRGQMMHFGKQLPNRLRSFFFDKEIVNSNGEDLYNILRNNHLEGRIVLDGEDAQVALGYTDITGRAIREVILEMVRLQEFSERPSRLSCLYAARNIEEALRWKQIFESYNRNVLQIVKVTFDGNYFEGDGDLLPRLSGEPVSAKIQQAQAYWRGTTEHALPEVLIDGRIEVAEIVQEFGTL
jgi:hypothetical protein